MESVSKLSIKIFSLDGGGNLESGREKGGNINELAPLSLTTHPAAPSPPWQIAKRVPLY